MPHASAAVTRAGSFLRASSEEAERHARGKSPTALFGSGRAHSQGRNTREGSVLTGAPGAEAGTHEAEAKVLSSVLGPSGINVAPGCPGGR